LPEKSFVATREPGGAPFAEKIRELMISDAAKTARAETQFGLAWAARADHLYNFIIPNLKAGRHVISDRFDSSTYAYQIYGQGGGELEKLFWQTRAVYLREQKPDLYIFFDVDPKIGMERALSRKGGKTHFDAAPLDYYKRVEKGFIEFFKKVPHAVIDANQPIEKVERDFAVLIKKTFNL